MYQYSSLAVLFQCFGTIFFPNISSRLPLLYTIMPYISKLQVINMHVLDVMTFTKKKKKITRHKGFKIALEAH